MDDGVSATIRMLLNFVVQIPEVGQDWLLLLGILSLGKRHADAHMRPGTAKPLERPSKKR